MDSSKYSAKVVSGQNKKISFLENAVNSKKSYISLGASSEKAEIQDCAFMIINLICQRPFTPKTYPHQDFHLNENLIAKGYGHDKVGGSFGEKLENRFKASGKSYRQLVIQCIEKNVLSWMIGNSDLGDTNYFINRNSMKVIDMTLDGIAERKQLYHAEYKKQSNPKSREEMSKIFYDEGINLEQLEPLFGDRMEPGKSKSLEPGMLGFSIEFFIKANWKEMDIKKMYKDRTERRQADCKRYGNSPMSYQAFGDCVNIIQSQYQQHVCKFLLITSEMLESLAKMASPKFPDAQKKIIEKVQKQQQRVFALACRANFNIPEECKSVKDFQEYASLRIKEKEMLEQEKIEKLEKERLEKEKIEKLERRQLRKKKREEKRLKKEKIEKLEKERLEKEKIEKLERKLQKALKKVSVEEMSRSESSIIESESSILQPAPLPQVENLKCKNPYFKPNGVSLNIGNDKYRISGVGKEGNIYIATESSAVEKRETKGTGYFNPSVYKKVKNEKEAAELILNCVGEQDKNGNWVSVTDAYIKKLCSLAGLA